MPKSFQQKLKILYLMRVFSEKTDEAHPMSVKDLISYLESLGIHAERKTIYDDIETLRVFGMDIMNRRERPSGFYLASREFETAELKLLVDAVQFSRFLTVGKSRQSDPETGAPYQYLSGQRPTAAGNRTGSGEEYKREHLL